MAVARFSDHSDSDHAQDRILMIRPSALGDVSRTVPVLVSLREAFPDSRIDWLVADSFADAVRAHPALSGVVEFPRSRFDHFWRSPSTARALRAWGKRLRDERYGMAIDLQGLFRSGWLTRQTRAARRIGDANARELAPIIGYNEKYVIDPKMHTVDRMLALVEAAGVLPVRDMRLYTGQTDAEWRKSWFAEKGIDAGHYAVVAPTAKWLCKCWPIERFIEVAGRLLDSDETGGKIRHLIVLASPAEQTAIKPLAERFANDDRVSFPATSVGQMLAIIEHCRLIVCNDSAPLHVAVGFDRSIAAIFGPTDPALVGPYRRAETVIQPPGIARADMTNYRKRKDDQSLIARIAIDTVWNKAIEQLHGT